MKKNIEKIIIILVILLGIIFVWNLKNGDKSEDFVSVNDEKIMQELNNVEEKIEKVEEPNAAEEKIEKVEEPNAAEEKIEKVEEPNVVEEEIKKIEELNVVEEEIKKIEEPNVVEEETEKVEIDLDDPNFDLVITSLDLETLTSYKLPILVDFGADGCMPCKMMEPTLHELNSELRGKAIIKFIDVWQYPEAAEGFDFSLIPTQFFFDKEGNLYKSHTGYLAKEEIVTILKEMGMEE